MAFGGAEIDDFAGLAPVGGVVIGRRHVAVAFDKGRAPFAGVIAFGAFDLDDFGPEVGEGLTNPRPREDAGEFDDFQTFERFHGCPSEIGG